MEDSFGDLNFCRDERIVPRAPWPAVFAILDGFTVLVRELPVEIFLHSLTL